MKEKRPKFEVRSIVLTGQAVVFRNKDSSVRLGIIDPRGWFDTEGGDRLWPEELRRIADEVEARGRKEGQ